MTWRQTVTWATEPIEIQDRDLIIRNIRREDFSEIASAIHDPDGFFGKHWGVNSPDKIYEMLAKHLEAQENRKINALVYLIKNEVAGITRFFNIEPTHRSLEIGGTWIAPKWRRTSVNTRVKYQLLRHAFQKLNAERVEFRVNAFNVVSQMAVLRIGATFEGRLRRRQIHPSGEPSDGHIYSVIKPEWPEIEIRLQNLLLQRPMTSAYLPLEFETPRLCIRVYRLKDADEFLSLAIRNKKSLRASFPQTASLDSLEAAKLYIAEKFHLASSGTSFFYAVWDKARKVQIGQLQIKNIDWKIRSADLGYFIDEESRRRGYATEMLEVALAELNLKKFNRIYVRVLEENIASLGVIENLGFQREGIQRAAFMTGDGELKDVLFLAQSSNSFMV
jgi:RimJ/RimL family protein N-acetyltransferase